MRQLVNGQGIPVLVHVAVDLGTVILEVISRVQLLAFQASITGSVRLVTTCLCSPVPSSRKRIRFPQLLANLLKQQNIVGVPEGIRVNFPEHWELFLDLRNARFALQQ